MEADRMFNNHSSILKLKITSTDRLDLQLSELYENEINQILVFDYRDSSNYAKPRINGYLMPIWKHIKKHQELVSKYANSTI